MEISREVVKYNIDKLTNLAVKMDKKSATKEEVLYKILEIANDLRNELKKFAK